MEAKNMTEFVEKDLNAIDQYAYRIIRTLQTTGQKIRRGMWSTIIADYAYGYDSMQVLSKLVEKEKQEGKSEGDIFKEIEYVTKSVIERNKDRDRDYEVRSGDFKTAKECYTHFREEYVRATTLKNYVIKWEKDYIDWLAKQKE